MTRHKLLTLLIIGITGLALATRQDGPSRQERLWQHRNLGKAFYENTTTLNKAAEEFKKALDLAPDSPRERLNYGLALLRAGHTQQGIDELRKVQQQAPQIPHSWFNLGIEYKKTQQLEEAIRQLQGFVERVPDDAISQYNLGVLYRLSRKPEEAMLRFEAAARLDPNLAAPHFQLASMYRRLKRMDESRREQTVFRNLKRAQQGAAIPEDLEWGIYSEILDDVEEAELDDKSPPPALQFQKRPLPGEVDPSGAGLAVIDFQRDHQPDLLAWSSSGLLLFEKASRPVEDSGLEEIRGVRWAAAGDFNNDGFPDLCVVTSGAGGGAGLYLNREGRFSRHPARLPSGAYARAVWLDFDHDYDLDLFLLGKKSLLMRNNGQAGFSDETARFPFVAGEAVDAVWLDSVRDRNGMDLAVAYKGRQGVLYRDRLGGKYQAVPLPGLPPAARSLIAFDINNDGWTDLAFSGGQGVTLLMNRQGRFRPAPVAGSRGAALAFADLDNRGAADLIAASFVHRNLGRGRIGLGRPLPQAASAAALAEADFNQDGRTDLALISSEGRIEVLENRLKTGKGWIQIGLNGVRNLLLAAGSEVEVKAGGLYQKRIYQGVPLLFGLGTRQKLDTVRITWPNGLIQNETQQPLGQPFVYEEKQRLSGSCPMIFTWNGNRFEFITDVLGVAPLGASAGDGEYFEVDHDEYIQIGAGSLAPVDGQYQVRITEELREVAYIDHIRLIAVDHPSDLEVFSNDKFKSPPFPEFRLYGVKRKIYPVAARDEQGRDVLDRILRRDRTYPDGFRRDLSGLAEEHLLELDFGPQAALDNRSVLILSGWVDWADGSTFLRTAQEERSLATPSLQVQDASGRWRTVIEDMGMPAGKPKTMAVDLTGKFLSSSRRIRILTNLCLYWDEIFLSEETGPPEALLTPVPMALADLGFRGFSTPLVHPRREQPEAFDYAKRMPVSMWNQTPGFYTRFGDVRGLLERVDDRFVVMGSGDELQLLFRADALPGLKEGWRRDFLLYVDGWAKDGDLNTAFSQSVEPLPFHGMSRYPYPREEAFPADAEHRLYRRNDLTRPALRLLQPLAPRSVPKADWRTDNLKRSPDQQ